MGKSKINQGAQGRSKLSTSAGDAHSLDLVAEENYVEKVRIMRMPKKS